MGTYTEVALFSNDEQIGTIGLNGYKAFTASPIEQASRPRLVWGFAVIDGNRQRMHKAWSHGDTVEIQTTKHKASARILAYPTSKDGHGLIEFF